MCEIKQYPVVDFEYNVSPDQMLIWSPLVEQVNVATLRLGDAGVEPVYDQLRAEYPHVSFKMPEDLINFLHHVSNFIDVPEPPSYEAPPAKETVKTLGPVSVRASDKQKRVRAADKFLEKIEDYKNLLEQEISSQKKAGLLFDAEKLSATGQEILIQFGKLYWHLNDQQEILGPSPSSIAEGTNADTYADSAIAVKKRLQELLLLTGAIYSVATCTTLHFDNNSVMTEELMEDLVEIKTNLYINDEEDIDPIENLLLDVRDEIHGDSEHSSALFPSIQNAIYKGILNVENDSLT